MVGARSSQRTNRRRIGVWAAAAVLAAILFVVLWVAVRAVMARDELLAALPIAQSVSAAGLSAIDGDIRSDVQQLQAHTSRAESLTTDFVWRAAEFVPVVGVNLSAFRETAAMIDDVAVEALPPLADIVETFSLDSLAPKSGAFDLSIFSTAAPLIAESSHALEAADARAAQIETGDTIAQVGTAVDQVKELVSRAKDAVGGLDTAVTLLPPMLGADEPRSYLLLSLNNSELRAAGGIPGAVAILNVNQGKIELGTLSSANDLGEYSTPPLSLTEAEETLFNSTMGTYLQNVTSTPDFGRSAELAQAMWETSTGQRVDGVLSLDPVATGYLLGATGPIDAGAGVTLTADNAADFLLSGVYARFAEPSDQDEFFAAVTGRVFDAITSGQADTSALVGALARASDEGRVLLWSARQDEQARLSGAAIAGATPTSTAETTGFGVYFNDATGGKMDYYLSSSVAIASAVCRNDGRPNFEVRVRLQSSAPVDAAKLLPAYVTADGNFGVLPGNVSTNVYVYAPSGSVPFSVTIDGQEYAFAHAEDGTNSVAAVNILLAPGQQSTAVMKFVGLSGAAQPVTLDHTPMASPVETSLDNYLDCADVAPAPSAGDEQQSGASSVHGGSSDVLALPKRALIVSTE